MATDAAAAYFSLTQAEYAAGNFKQKVAEGSMTARVRVGAGVDNVAGVKLPVFTKYDTGAAADNQSLGLVGGGKKIVAVREKFTSLLEMLIKYVKGGESNQHFRVLSLNLFPNRLASLQTSFVTLDEALKGMSQFSCTCGKSIESGPSYAEFLLSVTNRRVNALENVTIPKIEGILDYIARELDELEREGEKT